MTFSNEIREEVTSIKLFKKNEIIVFLDAVIIFSGIYIICYSEKTKVV